MTKTETISLKSIKQDTNNANKHTERGTYMLGRSIERFGFLEPGVIDINNVIIGGNNRAEVAADILGADKTIVIDIDGTVPVFVRRRDIDISTPNGREAAIALNRTAQVGIDFDPVEIDFLLDSGIGLDDWFRDDEIEGLERGGLNELGEPTDPRGLGNVSKQIKIVLYSEQVAVLEQAILATGETNRGEAVARICGAYLGAETKRQFDF